MSKTTFSISQLILKGLAVSGLSVMTLAFSGCSFSPSINVLGSYFPAWIICCAVGIGVTALVHYLFARWKIIEQLWPLALLYPCLIIFVSCSLWLVLFR